MQWKARARNPLMVDNQTVLDGELVTVVQGGPESNRCLVEYRGKRDWVDRDQLRFTVFSDSGTEWRCSKCQKLCDDCSCEPAYAL